jgi:orotate phosphoribosyltransferase
MGTERSIAKALLEIKAVGFRPDDPFRFKSGILSPIYVDNRILPAHPAQWKKVLQGFKKLIESEKLKFDAVAGIEAAGIPHSAALGYVLQRPSFFVRKQAKDHGAKKMIEGGSAKGKKILLVEDLVTTGMSSLHGVDVIRQEKGIVTDCLAIVSYGFAEARTAFGRKRVKLHTLTNFDLILEEAMKRKQLTVQQEELLRDWLHDPWGWEKRRAKKAR